jgi:AcrR family transcriptional regulator
LDQILTVAWELAGRDGLAAISLRELADRVDMRQPSLYTYFSSKAALYDAMFAQGFQQLVDEREHLDVSNDPSVALRQGCRHFIDFCVENPVRYQLLFQHSIPGFHPSVESMAIAERALGFLQRWLQDAGVTDPAGLDLMRAMLLGVAGEQIANEPGGQRWTRFTDDLADIVAELTRRRAAPSARTTRRRNTRG